MVAPLPAAGKGGPVGPHGRTANGIRLSRSVPVILFLALATVPLAAEAFGSSYWVTLATRILIFAIAALALDFVLGIGGLVSFGHAAFVGIGAYAVGIAASHGMGEGLLALPLAICAAAGFGLVTGAVAVRTRGVYFIMITLAFAQMAFFTATSLSAYGGDDGLTIWNRMTLAGMPVLESDVFFFYLVLAATAGTYLLCRAIAGSRFGRVIGGCRQNPERMAAIGFDPYPYRLTAYTISAALAGLAGALFATHTSFVAPAMMSWHRSGELIVMVVLGGVGSLHGAILGAAAYLLAEEYLSRLYEHWRLLFAPLIVLAALYARGGLAGLLQRMRRG